MRGSASDSQGRRHDFHVEADTADRREARGEPEGLRDARFEPHLDYTAPERRRFTMEPEARNVPTRDRFSPRRQSIPAPFFRAQRLRSAVRRSRETLLSSLDGARDVTFVRSWGNIGDELIYAGIRQLLAGLDYTEVSLRNLDGVGGQLAILAGGGAWCRPFHEVLPGALPEIEDRFERVVIFPSSFDPSVDVVREALLATRARVFAREPVSYELIREPLRRRARTRLRLFLRLPPFPTTRQGGAEGVPYRCRVGRRGDP